MTITIISIVLALIIFIGIFLAGFVSASPEEIKVISGPRRQRIIHGKTGWKIPILERVDTMTAEMISIDAKTNNYIPTNDFINVRVDAAVKVRIITYDVKLFESATRNFLHKSTEDIASIIRDTLEGHLRAITGQLKLKEIVQERDTFSEKVQENAKKDLEEMGLEIIAFNIQGVEDESGVIVNLGIDNTERIRKDAAKAKAVAIQEIEEQEAISKKIANDARVNAELEMAQRNTDLEIKKAELKRASEIKRAQADASYEIEKETQRKEIERQTAEANIVKQEKEAEVKQREVKVMEQYLEAEVKKKVDAEKIERMNQAEAEKYEAEKEAEALKAKAEAERFEAEQQAISILKLGEAEAEAIRLKAEAEAEGLSKKADAMLKMQNAAITEMVMEKLPEIAKNIAEPLKNVDSITMYGEGNTAKMVGDLMKSVDQVSKGLGIDIQGLLQSFLNGSAIGKGINTNIVDSTSTEITKTEDND